MPTHSHQRFYDHPRFWDACIAMLLIVSASIAVIAVAHIGPQGFIGSNVLLGLIAIVMIAGWTLTFYGSFIEPRRMIIRRMTLAIPHAPHLKIVLASDFHLGPYKKSAFLEQVVRRINALKPDMILLLGDFIDNEKTPIRELQPFKDLHAAHGIFAVGGNHDAGCYLTATGSPYQTTDCTDDICDLLQSMGIRFLRNAHVTVECPDGPIVIAGIDDVFLPSSDIDATVREMPTNTPAILLSHNPDIILSQASRQFSLIVSGHTHGGQIRLPLMGPLGPIPTHIPKSFDQGLFTLENGTKLFISHGLGETWARARLFCPPEIVIVDIRPKM